MPVETNEDDDTEVSLGQEVNLVDARETELNLWGQATQELEQQIKELQQPHQQFWKDTDYCDAQLRRVPVTLWNQLSLIVQQKSTAMIVRRMSSLTFRFRTRY